MGKLLTIPTTQGDLEMYVTAPKSACRGGIILIHEAWGLADHIKDVAVRLSAEGYYTVAPDFISDHLELGNLSGLQEDLFNPKKRNETQPKLRKFMAPIQNPEFGKETTAKLADCFSYLSDVPDINQNIAVIGFCFGGTYSFNLAVIEPRLKLAIPFYGHSDQSVEELRLIRCPVRAFYDEMDSNLMDTLPGVKDRMEQAAVDFVAKVYPDCGHAFFNDTNKFAYNKAAALDAWRCMLDYLQKYVG